MAKSFPTSFETGIEKIGSLEIQGAENIAKYSLKLIKKVAKEYKDSDNLLTKLTDAKLRLFKSRPTEPCMRNALNYVLLNLDSTTVSLHPDKVIERVDSAIDFLEKSEKHIAELGARRIKNGMVVFTHCHSSTVVDILKKAKDNKVHFDVINTETRPRFQGRKTAKELADYGISVTHMVDSAARIGLKKADLMLIGCDAIIESRIYNKIGSELLCEVAERYDIPVYVCTTSWKYDPLAKRGYEDVVEERSPDEVWEDAPKNVNVLNPAFEKINTNLISSIISELGILSPNVFLEEVRDKYRWM